LKRLQSSEPLHTKNPYNPPTSSADGLYGMGTNRNLFRQTGSKKAGESTMFFGRLVSRIFEEFQHPVIETKIVQHFGGFFHPIKIVFKSCAKEAGRWMHFCMKQLRTSKSFFLNSRSKFLN
jgi:hypothetical protein